MIVISAFRLAFIFILHSALSLRLMVWGIGVAE
jgi:hypothetical protein